MFTIHFDDERELELGPPEPGTRYGTIVLGDDRETFTSAQNYWTAARYEAHWREAVTRVLDERRDACLITSLAGPRESNLLFWWPLYPDSDGVVVQNAILFFDQLAEPFDPDRPYRSVPTRTSVNEDRLRISEWRVSVSDLEAFARSAAPRALASGQAPRRDVHTRPPA